jgi:FkbM family methyltransferase
MSEHKSSVTDDSAGSNYLWALPYLDSPVHSVVEVGARDGFDAIALARSFSCRVDTFEASPQHFSNVLRNIRVSEVPNIHAHALALSDKNGDLDFWIIDESKYANSGLGSLYQLNFTNRSVDDADLGHPPVQQKVSVTGARFDSLGLPSPDLLAMDVQGSEIRVLQGFGSKLLSCRYIVCEAERVPSYSGGNSFRALHKFLTSRGWVLKASTIGTGTRLDRWLHFVDTNVRLAVRNRTFRTDRLYQGCFDVLYEQPNV